MPLLGNGSGGGGETMLGKCLPSSLLFCVGIQPELRSLDAELVIYIGHSHASIMPMTLYRV